MKWFSRLFGKGRTAVTAGQIHEIAIFRSSGRLETGWQVDEIIDNELLVSAAGRFKCVPMADVLRANPVLLIGRTLWIRRSSSELETDWRAVCLRGTRVLMAKLGLKNTVSLENVVSWNYRCCEFAQAA